MKQILALTIFAVLFTVEAKAAPAAFALEDNRLITQIYINNKGPFFVMFDTGAGNILSNDLAKNLNIPMHDDFSTAGGGADTVRASRCDVSQMRFAGVTFQHPDFICMDLKGMQRAIGFPRLDGLIGYEVLAQFRAEVDMDQKEIRLSNFSDPITRSSTSQVVPFDFYGTTPTVMGVLDGITEKFLLDTGDRASMTLSSPFTSNNSLVSRYRPQFSMMTGYGVGGPLSTAMVFASQVKLGDLIFSKALVRLPVTVSAGMNDPEIAGTVGMGLLRQFNMVIDYKSQTLTLTKNYSFVQDRSFDRSGMWLSQGDGVFHVEDILKDGPAFVAGIHVGQDIIAVNGQSASDIHLLSLREMLKDPGLNSIEMTVKNGLQNQSVTVLLRDLL